MTSKLLQDCTDEDILCITELVTPRGQRYRRDGATRVWKHRIGGRMRFHIPLMYGLYVHTFVDSYQLLFNTGGWPDNTEALIASAPYPVRFTSGKSFVPRDLKELKLRDA